MHYITRISLSKLSENEKEQVLKVLKYCREHDKTGDFNYTLTENAAYITSKTREQALKRGMYFKKRFNIYFNILIEQQEKQK
jgi:Na+/phosphate symporter